jgi:hypothetical protein
VQTLVEVFTGHTPTADQHLEHAILLAEARHNLIARLIEDQRVDQAAALVPATLTAYRAYAALPGADILRVGRDLNQLAAQLAANGLDAQAAAARQAAQDLGI